jgi:hypothetical protein
MKHHLPDRLVFCEAQNDYPVPYLSVTFRKENENSSKADEGSGSSEIPVLLSLAWTFFRLELNHKGSSNRKIMPYSNEIKKSLVILKERISEKYALVVLRCLEFYKQKQKDGGPFNLVENGES